MDKHVVGLDLLTLANGMFVPKPNASLFLSGGFGGNKKQEWVSADTRNGELFLKQYSATNMWERKQIAASLCRDIVEDFELSKGIFEDDVSVLKQHAEDIVQNVFSKVGSRDGGWYLYHIATDANDPTSMIYIVMEFNDDNDVFITKLRACGGYNSQVIYARAQMLNSAYEPYMSKSIH